MLVYPPAGGPDVAAEDLESLREQLDALDQVLLDTVRDRICCCLRIAGVKRCHGMPSGHVAKAHQASERGFSRSTKEMR
jgi:chorismate mutase